MKFTGAILRGRCVQRAFDQALNAGATLLSRPEKKPWGQVVAYVRDADGHVIEISTRWTA